MAPLHVIEDSDEDFGDIASPGLLSPSAGPNEVVVNSMMQSSSTDPMLFRAVYEEHLGQLLVDNQIPHDAQLPTLEDPIFNQRMSSSLSMPSARKLKRSNTTNISSFSSITEPSLSNRKAMHPESTKTVYDLTQITTPRRSKETTRNDLWEVPSSNASDKAICGDVMLKGKNSDKSAIQKTYGRQTRRSQTMTSSVRSKSYDSRMSSPMEDDILRAKAHKMLLKDQHGDGSVDSKPPRRKRARLDSSEIHLTPTEELSTESRSTTSVAPGNHTSVRIPSELLQLPENMGENMETEMKHFGVDFSQVLSLPTAASQTVPEAHEESFYAATKSFTTQALPMSSRSIAIVPDVLSEEQKSQYEIVSVASTIQSSRSSHSELAAEMTSDEGYSAASDVERNVLPSLAPYSKMIEDKSRAIFTLSSLPISAGNRKMKRANSEMAFKEATTHSNDKILKRRKRNKTIGLNEKLPCREASVDELCVTSQESVQKSTAKFLARREKKPECENEEDRMRDDELHSYKETGMGNEKYKSQPNPHKPRSILIETITDGPIGLKIDTMESLNMAGKQIYTPAPESIASGLAQPKRRGRKKTSEIIVANPVSVIDTINLDCVPVPTKDHEIQPIILNETDSNKQPFKEMAITHPAKNSDADVDGDIRAPVQTPTKDSKKGHEEHSPLQSGKVPYRVGLSRKTRIAPLLKMIRK